MKNIIYFHITLINKWNIIVMNIMNILKTSKLLDDVNTVLKIGVLGDKDKYTELTELLSSYNNFSNSNIIVKHISYDIGMYEFATLKILIDDIYDYEEDYNILYLHSKGVSYTEINKNITDWTNMMLYYLCINYNKCIEKLKEYDTVGVNYNKYPHKHYSGNFWWCRSKYLSTLKFDIASYSNRHYAEFFILSGNPRIYIMHNSYIDHYKSTYDKSLYVNAKPEVKYCLNMIVKNEAHILNETLTNLLNITVNNKKFITYYVISDTGSTDNTEYIIRSKFEKHKIQGKIFNDKWENFAHNRTLALKHCHEEPELNVDDEQWMIYIHDADDLIINGDNMKFIINNDGAICPDAYNMYMRSSENIYGYTYNNIRMVTNKKHNYKWEGVLHEYPYLDNNTDLKTLEGDYYILSRRLGDRSKSENKYKNDANILTKAIEDDMLKISRYCFYAGQSFMCCDDYDNAIKYYEKRILMDGWQEEVFFSYCQIIKIMIRRLEDINSIEKQIKRAEISSKSTGRIEHIYIFCQYCEYLNTYETNNKGYNYSLECINIPYNNNGLFVDKHIYDFEMKFICARFAFKLKNYNMCKKITDLLLSYKFTDDNLKQVFTNFYIKLIENYKDVNNLYTHYNYEKVIYIYNMINNKKDKFKNVVLTITTCKRLELFINTMNSIINCFTDIYFVDNIICIDDNSSLYDRNIMKNLYPFINFIYKSNSESGHAKSMNMLYRSMIHYTYHIHMEDDWTFIKPDNYITRFIHILKNNKDNIYQMLFNVNYNEKISLDIGSSILKNLETEDKTEYYLHRYADPNTEEYKLILKDLSSPHCTYWPHYSLRPSINICKMYENVGMYNENVSNFEMEYAHRFNNLGYKSGFDKNISCIHTGKLTDDKTTLNAYDMNKCQQFGQEKYINVKMICDWTTGEKLCNEFNKMSINGDYTWKNIKISNKKDIQYDFYVIINKIPESTELYEDEYSYIPEKTIIYHMEPYVNDNTKQWGRKTWKNDWNDPDVCKFLQVRCHNFFMNNIQFWFNSDFKTILSLNTSKTTDKVSIRLSNKNFDEGHIFRHKLTKFLDSKNIIDIYGNCQEFNYTNYSGEDNVTRYESMLKYKYVLACENNVEHNFITEKFTDAILAEALPFYYGTSNIKDYYDEKCFIMLSSDIEESYNIINNAINNDEWSKRIEYIKAEKNKIMYERQFFPTLYNNITAYNNTNYINSIIDCIYVLSVPLNNNIYKYYNINVIYDNNISNIIQKIKSGNNKYVAILDSDLYISDYNLKKQNLVLKELIDNAINFNVCYLYKDNYDNLDKNKNNKIGSFIYYDTEMKDIPINSIINVENFIKITKTPTNASDNVGVSASASITIYPSFFTKNNIEYYCINLKNREDRYNNMQTIFNDIGLQKNVRFIEATEGSGKYSNLFIKRLFNNNDFSYRKGFIGCALSHFILWNQINSSVNNYFMIFEDDIMIDKNIKVFDNYIHNIISKNVEKDWDIIYLGYHSKPRIINNNIGPDELIEYSLDISYGGTFSYIINKSGINKLLQYINEHDIKHGIDYTMMIVKNMKQYCINIPLITSQMYINSTNDSDIQKNYDSCINGNILKELLCNTYTDKNTTHSYVDTYIEIFETNKLQYKVKNALLLSCGDSFNGDLFMMNNYFVNANITCITPLSRKNIVNSIMDEKFITIYVETEPYILDIVNKLDKHDKYDLIIDDGYHTYDNYIFVINYYIKLLSKDGIIIIEDIPDINIISKLKDYIDKSNLKLDIKTYDLRNVKQRFDDIMIVIKFSEK